VLEKALKERERVIENYEHVIGIQEIGVLKDNLEQIDYSLEARKKENKTLQERMKTNNEEMIVLQEYVSELEEKYKFLENENENLKKGIQNKEKTILNLEQEISTVAEDVKDSHNETINDLQKKNQHLNQKITELERRASSILKQKELLEETLKSEISDLTRNVEALEKDKKQSLDTYAKMNEDNKKLQENIKLQELEFNRVKQDLQKEAAGSILRLKGEKMELEHQIQDLIRQLDLNRTSIKDEFSLQDELSQLEDFRGSRISTPQNGKDSKKLDVFKEMVSYR
jgi:chromosome segregation ATPase